MDRGCLTFAESLAGRESITPGIRDPHLGGIHLPPVRTFSRAIITRPRFASATVVRMLKPCAVKSVRVAPSETVAAITASRDAAWH